MATVRVLERVAGLARQQHGLVTRAQLVGLGVGRRQIEGWTANARLDRLLPGVFQLAGVPTSREQRFHAAVLWAGADAVVSHRAAAELWGFDGVAAARPEITVPTSVRKRCADVVVHQSRATPIDRRTRRGVPITTPERTIIDLAGSLRAEPLEIAFESARRERHLTTASVARSLTRLGTRGRAGCESLSAVLTALASEPPAESALEVVTARVLRASDLPKPQRQLEVAAPAATYRLDFAWPDALVALECDGRKWHQTDAAFERDRRRWSAITATTGYRIVWATWVGVTNEPQELIARVREALTRRVNRRDPYDPSRAACGGRPADRSATG